MWMRLLTAGERPSPKQAFLDPERWQQLPLVKKQQLSHNSRRFRHVAHAMVRTSLWAEQIEQTSSSMSVHRCAGTNRQAVSKLAGPQHASDRTLR